MQMRKFSSSKYRSTCVKRNSHAPLREDVDDFLKNSRFSKETVCSDCGTDLELRSDENDSEYYWIREV